MSAIVQLKAFRKNIILSHRSICMGRPRLISDKNLQKLKLKQARMQCEDNLPVYLKCGTRDKVVYWIIVAFTVYCTIQSFKGIKNLEETVRHLNALQIPIWK